MPTKKDVGPRPKCPECGTPEPYLMGPNWMCRNCGRMWRRKYRQPPQTKKG